MKKRFVLIFIFIINIPLYGAQGIQPYILIGESGKSVSSTSSLIVQSLFFSDDQFEIIGQYSPMDSPDRKVLIVTNPTLREIVGRCKPSAGYFGVIRISITEKNEMTYISCQNPEYWAIAFLQDEYEREKEAVSQFTSELKHSMPRLRMRIDLGFGSTQDFEESDIRKYRYNFRAPYFQNAVKVGEFNNFTDAKSKLETSFGNSTANALIFDVNIISEKVQLIGLNLSQEADIFLQLDDADRKHTACMPYELLIIEDAIYMLDPRYRLAVSFPDINSKKYSKIKAIGKAIEAEINELLTN